MKLSSEIPFAEVAFNLPIKEVFSYKIPPEFLGKVQVGMRVFVPFGRRHITGYVVNLVIKWDKNLELKNLILTRRLTLYVPGIKYLVIFVKLNFLI